MFFLKKVKGNLINYSLLLIICIFFFSLVFSNYNHFFFQHGDSAFFVDLISKIGNENTIFSSIYSSHFYMGKYLVSQPDIYCTFNNNSPNHDINIFKAGHLYLIVFLFSFFAKIGVNAILLSSIIFSLNFVLIFYSIYFFLNKKSLGKFYVYLFLILIFFFLPFSMSWVGQFYFDRLYILPMILLIFLINDFSFTRNHKIIFFILLIYISILHERAAFMTGCYLIAQIIFFYQKNYKFRLLFTMSGLVLILYFIVYIKFFQTSYYAGVYTIPSLINNINLLINNSYNVRDISIKLLIINLPLLFLCSLNPKHFLICLGTLFPNIFFYIGGAEKIGLTTHYHTFYIPFLISGAAFGLLKYVSFYKKKSSKPVFFTFIFLCTIFNLTYDFSSRDKIIDFKRMHSVHGKELYLMKTFPYLYKDFWTWKKEKNIMPVQNLLNQVPLNESVSVHENLQVFFATKKNKISFFPLGLGKSNYLVVEKQDDKNNNSITFASFLAADKKEEILQCINEKITNNYSLLDKSVLWHGGSVSLYKKKQQ